MPFLATLANLKEMWVGLKLATCVRLASACPVRPARYVTLCPIHSHVTLPALVDMVTLVTLGLVNTPPAFQVWIKR